MMARYEWPATNAFYGPRHAAPSPSVAPAAESRPAESTPPSSPVQHIADGEHASYRWYVVRHPDALHPIVTVQGWDGPHYVTETRDMEGASPAKVKRWVETIIAARKAAADAKNARRKGGR